VVIIQSHLLFTCSFVSAYIVGQSFDFSKLTGSLTDPLEIDPKYAKH
jgi:hypothetical protein